MLENIKSGEKYTLLIENTMGFIVSRPVRIIKATLEKDQNNYNDEKLIIHYIGKGKRKAEGWKYSKEQRFAIISGWKEVKGTIQDKNINTFVSFQDGNFENIIKENNLETLYIQ